MIMLRRFRRPSVPAYPPGPPPSGPGSGGCTQKTREDPDERGRQGQIVTFYSYKGGTGRTMALANTAWILASNGKRVLAVDWDLESPGPAPVLPPVPRRLDGQRHARRHRHHHGVRLGRADRRAASRRLACRTTPASRSRTPSRCDWVISPAAAALDFLSAGRQNRDYSAAVCSLDWDNFYDRLGGGQFFRTRCART